MCLVIPSEVQRPMHSSRFLQTFFNFFLRNVDKYRSSILQNVIFHKTEVYIVKAMITSSLIKFTVATSRKVAESIPGVVVGFFSGPNPSRRTTALGSTQPLTEMSTSNLPSGKGRPKLKADNLTAICEPIV
jgi:hypothetical protein